MIKKYVHCRGTDPNQEYSDNIVKITKNDSVKTIYINSGPTKPLRTQSINLPIAYGNLVLKSNELLNYGTHIDFTNIYDAGYGSQAPIPGVLDDANVPIPMMGVSFNFFGTSVSNNMYWNSNNAITIGTMSPNLVSISRNTVPAILLGNYDRLLTKLSYINTVSSKYSITTLYPKMCNYFTDTPPVSQSYTWRVRIIKENTGSQRQFIEVCVGPTSLPTPGYSSSIRTYPSGLDVDGNPIDSNGLIIDQTKNSPFNITNGTTFLNLCGTTFGASSPPANTSFVFSSDSTGTNWVFTNNACVNA
jgi:hypothetical protein